MDEGFEWIKSGEDAVRQTGLRKEKGTGFFANHVEEVARYYPSHYYTLFIPISVKIKEIHDKSMSRVKDFCLYTKLDHNGKSGRNMGRPAKNPEFDERRLQQELVEVVVQIYNNSHQMRSLIKI